MWLTVYLREYSPGENPSILKILSAGLSSLLNTLFGRDMHFEKERIDLRGSDTEPNSTKVNTNLEDSRQ